MICVFCISVCQKLFENGEVKAVDMCVLYLCLSETILNGEVKAGCSVQGKGKRKDPAGLPSHRLLAIWGCLFSRIPMHPILTL